MLLFVGLLWVFIKKLVVWMRKGSNRPESIGDAVEYVHSCIDGIFTWGGTKEEAFKYLWEMDDESLREVSIMYEMRYGETLKRAIGGEWVLFGEWKDKILERLSDMGI